MLLNEVTLCEQSTKKNKIKNNNKVLIVSPNIFIIIIASIRRKFN